MVRANIIPRKSRLLKFLEQIQPRDRFAIFALGHNFRVLQDFTGDLTALIAALSKHSGRATMDLDASTPTQLETGDDATDEILADAFQRESNYSTY